MATREDAEMYDALNSGPPRRLRKDDLPSRLLGNRMTRDYARNAVEGSDVGGGEDIALRLIEALFNDWQPSHGTVEVGR